MPCSIRRCWWSERPFPTIGRNSSAAGCQRPGSNAVDRSVCTQRQSLVDDPDLLAPIWVPATTTSCSNTAAVKGEKACLLQRSDQSDSKFQGSYASKHARCGPIAVADRQSIALASTSSACTQVPVQPRVHEVQEILTEPASVTERSSLCLRIRHNRSTTLVHRSRQQVTSSAMTSSCSAGEPFRARPAPYGSRPARI